MNILDKTNNILFPANIGSNLREYIQKFNLEETELISSHIFIMTPLNDVEYALYIINDSLWNGSINRFNFIVTNNHTFIESLTKQSLWNGACSYFSTYVTKNPDLMQMIVDSPFWDGHCGYVDCLDNKNLVKSIISSDSWNGDPGYFNIDDSEIYFDIIKSPKWNGDAVFYTKEENVYEKVLSSERWNGIIDFFPSSLLKNKDFCLKISQSDKWNGDFTLLIKYINLDDLLFHIMIENRKNKGLNFYYFKYD